MEPPPPVAELEWPQGMAAPTARRAPTVAGAPAGAGWEGISRAQGRARVWEVDGREQVGSDGRREQRTRGRAQLCLGLVALHTRPMR